MRAALTKSAHTPDQTIVLASNNPGKLAEFERLLAPLNLTIAAQRQFNVSAAPEPYGTFLENALPKAAMPVQPPDYPPLRMIRASALMHLTEHRVCFLHGMRRSK